MRRITLAIAFAVTLPGIAGAATATQVPDDPWEICETVTSVVATERRIPDQLLQSIAIVETGRWRADAGEIVAWPWTVSSGDAGTFFATRQEAINHVYALMDMGVTNIDVGCMQVNLRYHGDRFEDVNAAFDPFVNAGYAADFLVRLRSEASSWREAAGNYHSKTPEYHDRYRAKLDRIWNERRGVTVASSVGGSTGGGTRIVPVDAARTAEINAAFARRQEQELAALDAGTADGASTSGRGALFGADYALQAKINRARAKAEKQRRIDDLVRADRGLTADERLADLNMWRKLYIKANAPAALAASPGY